MKTSKWEQWAEQALKGRRLHEPPEQLIRRAERTGPRQPSGTAPVRAAAWPGWMRGLAAASLVGVAVIGTMLLRDGAPPLPERGVESTIRGSRVQLLSPSGEIAEAPSALAWRSFEGAASYRASILAVDDEVLWDRVVTGDSVELPMEIRDRLQPAMAYRWRVEASDADGAVIGRSEAIRFRIKP